MVFIFPFQALSGSSRAADSSLSKVHSPTAFNSRAATVILDLEFPKWGYRDEEQPFSGSPNHPGPARNYPGRYDYGLLVITFSGRNLFSTVDFWQESGGHDLA